MYDRTIMRTCDRLQCLKTFLRPLGKPRICVEVDEQVAMGGDLLRRAFGACGALPHVALVPEIVTDRHDEGSAMEFKGRSEEHTSELQSRGHLVCRLMIEKNNTTTNINALLSPLLT